MGVMKTILQVSEPSVYASYLGAPTLHPLVNVIHYDEVSPIHSSLNRYGVYGLFIQKNFPKNLTYGMKMFDAADGSIIAVEPGQIGGKEDDGEKIFISGWVLMFSPELLHGYFRIHRLSGADGRCRSRVPAAVPGLRVPQEVHHEGREPERHQGLIQVSKNIIHTQFGGSTL